MISRFVAPTSAPVAPPCTRRQVLTGNTGGAILESGGERLDGIDQAHLTRCKCNVAVASEPPSRCPPPLSTRRQVLTGHTEGAMESGGERLDGVDQAIWTRCKCAIAVATEPPHPPLSLARFHRLHPPARPSLLPDKGPRLARPV